MKVWPPGKPRYQGLDELLRRRSRQTSTSLTNWVLHDERLLIETRFGGDRAEYGAWRDHLWTEMHDTPHRRPQERRPTPDEEYVVMTAFGGNWAQYRVCRDRLREELWQIMQVTHRR